VLTGQKQGGLVCLNDQGGRRMDVEKGEQAPTLRSVTKGNLPIVARKEAYGFDLQQITSKQNRSSLKEVQPTLCSGGNPHVICRATALANAETLVDKSATLTCYHEQPIICKAIHQNQDGNTTTSDTAYSLTTASNASARNAPLVMAETWAIAATAIGRQPHNGGNGLGINRDVSPTLTATDRHAVSGPVHPDVSGTLCASGAGLSRPAGMASETDLCIVTVQPKTYGFRGYGDYRESDVSKTIMALSDQSTCDVVLENGRRPTYVVRRLTPTECERLQGFPDGWTALDEHGKPISDSKRYQMLGNSVAVPCVAYILQGMARHLREEDRPHAIRTRSQGFEQD
jgi:DNA (cytosine-5)-methyltransferase 1